MNQSLHCSSRSYIPLYMTTDTTLADIANVLGLPMREFFDVEDVDVSDARQRLLMQMNSMISDMDDRQLNLLLKLGQVLKEDGES